MCTRTVPLLALLCALILQPQVADAAVIEGTVRAGGKDAVSGALVTLTSEDGVYAETVYSDAAGRFRLATEQSGFLNLRVRKPNFADANRDLEVTADQTPRQDIRLRALVADKDISDQLTASAHYARIRFDDPKEHGFFQIECLTCHQLGNAYTRAPRTPDRWQAIVTRMLGFYGITDAQRINHYAKVLEQAFDGKPLTVHQEQPIDAALFGARITQWKLPGALIAHDVEYHAADGKFYTVDQGKDLIYITDPRANQTETFTIPSDGIPVGGKFLKLFNNPNPFSLAVSRGPHSLQEGPDGKFYTTDTVSGQIGVFDPATRTYVGHDIGGKAMYPHTLRFDKQGMVWFTAGVSNQLGRFNPGSGEMTLIDLPTISDRPEIPIMMPYGIDIHPKDGSVWYTRLMANRIGRVDPKTLAVEEFEPPVIGPRRMRFAKDGTLWIPSYGTGELVALDTATMKYRNYKLPPLSEGEIEAPYALNIHPQTQDVWITANMSDRMFRFLPKEERFISYPLPTRGIFLRDLIFLPDGRVCAASSMAAATLAVEGGMEEIICLDPGSG
jgi:DNA-binding beta-propeller fold protein YncE